MSLSYPAGGMHTGRQLHEKQMVGHRDHYGHASLQEEDSSYLAG